MMSLKRYFWLIHLMLIAAGAYIGADLVWAIMGVHMDVGGRVPPVSQSTTTATPEERPFQQYAVIQERNLFGAHGPTAAPTPRGPTPTAAPARSGISLKLVGTVVGSPDRTYAVIEDLSTKRQELYRLGDLVQEAKLVEITRNHAVLDNRGRREELQSFEEPGRGGPAAEPAGRPVGPPPVPLPGPQHGENPPNQANVTPPEEGEADVPVQPLGGNTWRISREELVEQMDNLGQFMKDARLTPHFTGGQADGFMISNLPKNSLLERMGLRNGDVLRGINGERFSSMDEVLQIYQQLQNEPTLQLEIERGSRAQTLTYEVR